MYVIFLYLEISVVLKTCIEYLLCLRNKVLCVYEFNYSSKQCYVVGTVIIPYLQMRKQTQEKLSECPKSHSY